jgi:multisubunit Na+/H+ antiporter MnhE subunit
MSHVFLPYVFVRLDESDIALAAIVRANAHQFKPGIVAPPRTFA